MPLTLREQPVSRSLGAWLAALVLRDPVAVRRVGSPIRTSVGGPLGPSR